MIRPLGRRHPRDMVRAAAWGYLVATLACLGGCSGDVSRGTPDDDPPPTKRDDPPDPAVPPDAGPPSDAGPSSDGGPPPDACAGYGVTGSGTTWLESPPSAGVQRPLRCLSPSTAELRGRFLGAIYESDQPDKVGSSASEADRIYDYALDDARANQPAGYYALTEMALAHVAIDSSLAYPALDLYTGPYFLLNSYYSGAAITLGRGGFSGATIDVQIATHEYGHHVIMTLVPELLLSTLHEGMADYFGCVFSDNPDFMLSVPPSLRRPCNNDHAWPGDAYDVYDACVLMQSGFLRAGWDQIYPSEYSTIEQCLEMTEPYTLEGHMTGMIVSGALWSLSEELGKETFLPILLRALKLVPGDTGDFGMLHDALVAADQQLSGGAHVAAIEAELAERGMLEDVGLMELEYGYGRAFPCLMTAEHRDADRLPAGPLLPLPRARVH